MKRLLAGLALTMLGLSGQVHAQSLTSGSSVNGFLGADQTDSYTFTGNSGEGVRFRVDESVTSVGRITLYKPDGSFMTFGNNEKVVTLPETGTYTATVKFTNATHSGNYTLHYLRGGDTVENGGLTSGSTHSGTLGTYDFDSYTFTGNSGEGVRFRVEESVTSVGRVILYKPDGSFMTFGNNAKVVTLPDTGTYTAVVEFTNATHAGDYTLHYLRGGDTVENGGLTSGSTHSDSLGAYDFDSYTFTGNSGEGVRFRLDESVNSVGRVILYKPNGAFMTFGNNAKVVTLPDTGTYTAVVEFTNPVHTGNYTLHYLRGGDTVENGALTTGSTHYDYLDAHDFDSFTYTGVADATVTFTVAESVNSVGRVVLYKPNGAFMTFGNNTKTVTLPETGTYTVVVEFTNPVHTGDYSISVN